MLIGSTKHSIQKQGKVARLQAEVIALQGLNKVLKEQVDSLLALEKQMVQKLAALGIRVKVERQGVVFEPVRLG